MSGCEGRVPFVCEACAEAAAAALVRSSLHSLCLAERRVFMDLSAPLYSIRTVWPESVEVAEERRGKVVKGRSRGSGSVQERLTD